MGKSVRIRSRLLSHFRSDRSRTRELLRVAQGVEWEPMATEFEAVMHEFRLIRTFQPRFNVRHRRRRSWSWIRITDEAAPRLVASRRPPPVRRPGQGRVFGPFPGTKSLPTDLETLSHATGLRDCSPSQPMWFADQLDLLAHHRAPACPRADLGSCAAPCAARCTRESYLSRVREASDFLSGLTDAPLQRMEARMKEAAGRMSFEVASRWRDRRERLAALRDRVVEHDHLLNHLTVVHRGPGTSAGGSSAPRLHLVVRARHLMSADEPPPQSAGALALAARIRRVLAQGSLEPITTTSERSWEERFLVAGWFRNHPGEMERTESPTVTLQRLEEGPMEEGAPTDTGAVPGRTCSIQSRSTMSRTWSNSSGSTG